TRTPHPAAPHRPRLPLGRPSERQPISWTLTGQNASLAVGGLPGRRTCARPGWVAFPGAAAYVEAVYSRASRAALTGRWRVIHKGGQFLESRKELLCHRHAMTFVLSAARLKAPVSRSHVSAILRRNARTRRGPRYAKRGNLPGSSRGTLLLLSWSLWQFL